MFSPESKTWGKTRDTLGPPTPTGGGGGGTFVLISPQQRRDHSSRPPTQLRLARTHERNETISRSGVTVITTITMITSINIIIIIIIIITMITYDEYGCVVVVGGGMVFRTRAGRQAGEPGRTPAEGRPAALLKPGSRPAGG